MQKIRIGILVSNNYQNFNKIKNTIYETSKSLGVGLEICQISENYKHDEIKKFVQEMGITYTDVLRFDEQFNINSHDQNQHKFNKPFDGRFFHIRNNNFLSYCDGIYGFIDRSLEKKDAVYQILRSAKDKKMKLKIFD